MTIAAVKFVTFSTSPPTRRSSPAPPIKVFWALAVLIAMITWAGRFHRRECRPPHHHLTYCCHCRDDWDYRNTLIPKQLVVTCTAVQGIVTLSYEQCHYRAIHGIVYASRSTTSEKALPCTTSSPFSSMQWQRLMLTLLPSAKTITSIRYSPFTRFFYRNTVTRIGLITPYDYHHGASNSSRAILRQR